MPSLRKLTNAMYSSGPTSTLILILQMESVIRQRNICVRIDYIDEKSMDDRQESGEISSQQGCHP
jgi:hypothetical protein